MLNEEPIPMPVTIVTMARLRGELCIREGCEVREELEPAGWVDTVTTGGARMGWPVKACPDHIKRPTGTIEAADELRDLDNRAE